MISKGMVAIAVRMAMTVAFGTMTITVAIPPIPHATRQHQTHQEQNSKEDPFFVHRQSPFPCFVFVYLDEFKFILFKLASEHSLQVLIEIKDTYTNLTDSF